MISKNGSSWQQIRYNTNGRSRKLSGGGRRSALARRSGVINLSRWENWSKVISGRYVSDATRRRPANIVFVRQASSPFSLWRVFRMGPFLLTPRINLGPLIHQHALYQTVPREMYGWPGLSSRQDENGRRAEPVAATTFLALRVAEATRRARESLDPMKESFRRRLQPVIETEQFVDRLLQRREPPQASGTSVALRSIVQPAAMVTERVGRQFALRPQPMILRRRSGSADESSGAPHSARQRIQNPSMFPADPAPGIFPSAAPVVDVGRLTDQVIQTIDRRLTAWRERMGRI